MQMSRWKQMKRSLVWCAVLAACGGGGLRLPMTAQDLARTHDPKALALYLTQPGADPMVCDASGPGPHAAGDDRVAPLLVDGLRARTIRPAVWRACVTQIFGSAGRAVSGALVVAIMRAIPPTLDARVDADPAAAVQVAALIAAYRERPTDVRVRSEEIDALAAHVQQRVAGLGAVGARHARELLATLDLERGRWQGRSVDAAFLDERAGAGDDATLALFAARLPDAALRAEAARRLVRLRIARSPFAEVREDAVHVEELVVRTGINPIAPRLQRPVRAVLDPGKLTLAGVQIDQTISQQRARLVSPGAAQLLGRIALRGALAVEIEGVSQPVTLCGGARELDPSPCLLPGDVAIDSPLVWRDREGGVHLVDQIKMDQVRALALHDKLALPIEIAGTELTAIELPLSFVARDVLVYSGGPRIDLDVEQRNRRLVYKIASEGTTRWAVIDEDRARDLAIVSRGADGGRGSDGVAGSDGMAGSDGSAASCPSTPGSDGGRGGDGSNGSDGSDGSDGGDGGAVQLRVRCSDGQCASALAILRDTVRSEGGAGGAGGSGGPGGRGGAGGRGGDSARCGDGPAMNSLSGGSDGLRGNDGSSGRDGRSGNAGRAGAVHVTTEKL